MSRSLTSAKCQRWSDGLIILDFFKWCFRRNGFRWRKRQSLLPGDTRRSPNGSLYLRPPNFSLFGQVERPQFRHHLLRQHRVGHVDRVPVREHGGVDSHSIFGESGDFPTWSYSHNRVKKGRIASSTIYASAFIRSPQPVDGGRCVTVLVGSEKLWCRK